MTTSNDTTTVTVTYTGPSDCSDHAGAIDATLMVSSRECEITLLPRESDGVLDTWGSLDHWADHNTRLALGEAEEAGGEVARGQLLTDIVSAVLVAVEA